MLSKHYFARFAAGVVIPILFLATFLISWNFTRAQPIEETVRLGGPFRYYQETGHNLGGAFLSYYTNNGGTEIFGFPITELITDTHTGMTVQYFERARMEWHFDTTTGIGQVHLTDIGSELTRTRSEPAFEQVRQAAIISGTLSMPGGGSLRVLRPAQQIFETFAPYYHERGDKKSFGQSLSVPLVEQIEGERYFVQYFERARMEYHPAANGQPAAIRLGLLGYDLARLNDVPPKCLCASAPLHPTGNR